MYYKGAHIQKYLRIRSLTIVLAMYPTGIGKEDPSAAGMKIFGSTAILIIIEGQFQVIQRFSSCKLMLNAVESRFVARSYCENGCML
jgi:hypothetical protein